MAWPKVQFLLGTLLLAACTLASAQNCENCPPYKCCLGGLCITTGVVCVTTSIEDVVTQQFFDGIIGQADDSCEGKGFYTRQAFLDAANQNYSNFGRDATDDNYKREIAAFFAHVTHQTGYFCNIEETDKSNSSCIDDITFPQNPCASRKKYYGRGPLQITSVDNYVRAGQDIGFDGLNSPETVSNDVVVSFKTALWLWMNNVHGVVNQGFGSTIRAINGAVECNGVNPREVNDRVNIYKNYCSQFGVSPGDNLTC